MKKTIIISLVVVFAVVLMAVPAFAAGSFTVSDSEHGLEVSGEFPSYGKYIAKVFCDLPDFGFEEAWYQLEPFILGCGGDIYDGSFDGISYFVVDGLRIEVQFAYIFDQDGRRLDYWQVYADGVQVESYLYAIELIPYSEPVTGEGVMNSLGEFFAGALGWFKPLLQLIQEQPLVLLFVVCIPLVGFGIWGFSKLKNA